MSWSDTIPSRGPESLPHDTITWWNSECEGLGHRGAAVSAKFPVLEKLATMAKNCGANLGNFVGYLESVAPADDGNHLGVLPKEIQDTILLGSLKQLVVDTFWSCGESPGQPVRVATYAR